MIELIAIITSFTTLVFVIMWGVERTLRIAAEIDAENLRFMIHMGRDIREPK